VFNFDNFSFFRVVSFKIINQMKNELLSSFKTIKVSMSLRVKFWFMIFVITARAADANSFIILKSFCFNSISVLKAIYLKLHSFKIYLIFKYFHNSDDFQKSTINLMLVYFRWTFLMHILSIFFTTCLFFFLNISIRLFRVIIFSLQFSSSFSLLLKVIEHIYSSIIKLQSFAFCRAKDIF
jgi:hypothetical protein